MSRGKATEDSSTTCLGNESKTTWSGTKKWSGYIRMYMHFTVRHECVCSVIRVALTVRWQHVLSHTLQMLSATQAGRNTICEAQHSFAYADAEAVGI